MRFILPILIIILVQFSCSSRNDSKIIVARKLDTLSAPTDSSVLYFPSKHSRQDTAINSLDTFTNTWYSQMLYTLKEPILSNYNGTKEIYRFTWLRSFDHPVVVRLEKQNDIIHVFTKISDGAGGYEPGKIIDDTVFDVSINEWVSFIKNIDEVNFWQMPTEIKGDSGTDGSEWIIEAINNGNYHMVTRYSPVNGRHEQFRSIGEKLITISKIKGETKHYY